MFRYDKDQLKENLTADDVIRLLHKLGAENVTDLSETKGYITANTICHNLHDGSEKLYYYVDSQLFYCFTECSCSFDIYELVQKRFRLHNNEISFAKVVEWVAQQSGKSFGFGFGEVEIKPPPVQSELEWMNRFVRKKTKLEEPPVYNDKILEVFSKVHHPSFLEDGISHRAMDKFEIMYYNKEERIVIPHRNKDGGLIGIKGRATRQDEIDRGFKYIPITVQNKMYNFPTHSNLYGLYQNQETIKRLKKVIIFESEKSVMQCETYWPNHNFSVALCGRNISQYQIDMLLELGVEEVQLALDKEFKEIGSLEYQRDIEHILKIGSKFAPYVRVYTLFDRYGLLDYKDSPSDKGKEILVQLMKKKEEIFSKST